MPPLDDQREILITNDSFQPQSVKIRESAVHPEKEEKNNI